MIKLSNGHAFKWVVASGALAFDGLGWPWEWLLVWLGFIKPELFVVFIKSLTRNRRAGYLRWWKPWTCMRIIPGGTVNKIGLTNKGVEWWCKKVGPRINFLKYRIAGSIFGNKQELVEMAIMLNKFDFVALEVNVSCPNSDHDLDQTETVIDSVKAVKVVSRHPIIVKVSADQDFIAIARGVKGFAEAISLNSVPWKKVFGEKRSPLWRLDKKFGGGGGGVSGKPAQKENWEAVRKLVEDSSLPVICPSVMDSGDVTRALELNPGAISFGAIHILTPCRPTAIVEREEMYARLHNNAKVV